MEERICKVCGAQLGEGENFCSKCGTLYVNENEINKKRICKGCGAELQEDQAFCPKCGTKYIEDTENTESITKLASTEPNGELIPLSGEVRQPKRKKIWIPIVAIIVAVAIGAILYFVLKGTPVTEVSLNQETLTMTEGKAEKLVCTVTPDDADDKTLIWSSSNESVAKVSEGGYVTAVSEGNCTITVTSNNGKQDNCKIIVEAAGPDLKAVYDSCCDPSFASIASDGSYMSVDTNPSNKDDYTDYAAYLALYAINEALELPDSLMEKMGSTRALDGRQSATYGKIEISWSYHPDKGLEVLYEVLK